MSTSYIVRQVSVVVLTWHVCTTVVHSCVHSYFHSQNKEKSETRVRSTASTQRERLWSVSTKRAGVRAEFTCMKLIECCQPCRSPPSTARHSARAMASSGVRNSNADAAASSQKRLRRMGGGHGRVRGSRPRRRERHDGGWVGGVCGGGRVGLRVRQEDRRQCKPPAAPRPRQPSTALAASSSANSEAAHRAAQQRSSHDGIAARRATARDRACWESTVFRRGKRSETAGRLLCWVAEMSKGESNVAACVDWPFASRSS